VGGVAFVQQLHKSLVEFFSSLVYGGLAGVGIPFGIPADTFLAPRLETVLIVRIEIDGGGGLFEATFSAAFRRDWQIDVH